MDIYLTLVFQALVALISQEEFKMMCMSEVNALPKKFLNKIRIKKKTNLP